MPGIGSIGGSDSTTKLNASTNTASESGLINAPRVGKKGVLGDVFKPVLGRGASLTINNGLSKDDLAGVLNGLGGVGSSSDGLSVEQAVENALKIRATKQIADAPTESEKNAFGTSNWILVGVGAVILLGLAFYKVRRKKT